MFLLPESIKNRLKTTKESWKHHFPHYKSIVVFLDIQVQITPYNVVLSGRNSKYIMHVLDTYKFKMDWIDTKREKWKNQFFRP